MKKLSRHFKNGISLLATILIPTRKALISVSSAVDPLSSDCIEIVRMIQTAGSSLQVKLVIHVDAANTHIKQSDKVIVVKKGSLRSVFYALTSRVSIVTHGLRDIGPIVNFKTVVFNVWHGAPMKKIGYHSKATLNRERMKNIGRAWDYLVVPNSAWVPLFSEAFGLPADKILPMGYPRYESRPPRLSNKDNQRFVRIVYIPTYRTGISNLSVYDFLQDPGFLQYLKINNVEFKVRLHPADKAFEGDVPVAMLCPRELSTEQMITQSDLLVTDCSSVIVDAAVLDINTSIYFPDFAQVEECLGGFYHAFPGDTFLCRGANLNMEEIISEFLKNRVGNYTLPPELIPRRDFCKSFLEILPSLLDKSKITLTSSQP